MNNLREPSIQWLNPQGKDENGVNCINIIPGLFMELADADRASIRDIFCYTLNSYPLN